MSAQTVIRATYRNFRAAGYPAARAFALTKSHAHGYRIGHNAYAFGPNAGAIVVWSKTAAIDELRKRGAKRDDARKAIARAFAGNWTGCNVGTGCVEITRQPVFPYYN